MATHSPILVWEIPRTAEPGGLQSMGSQESDTTERLNHHHPALGLNQAAQPISHSVGLPYVSVVRDPHRWASPIPFKMPTTFCIFSIPDLYTPK